MAGVSLAQALNLMAVELARVDKTFASQFIAFKTNILTLEKKVKTDQENFNSARQQSGASTIMGGNYYGRQFERKVGGRLGATNNENEFAYSSGVSRYV
jgi:hypothetical protein